MAAQPFPHRYQVNATAEPQGDVVLLGDGLRALRSQPPAAFGGPGDRWSPETLLVGAIADCFALTFRAVARAANLPWTRLECETDGTLDRVGRVPQFTAFRVRAYLTVPAGTGEGEARRVLERAREHCLVTHSLKAPCAFDAHVDVRTSSEAA
jgi:organic hydroperoxide reductase OsmC/OhrA